MRILAFDQATAKTGWAEFDDNLFVGYGKIDLSKNEDVDTRVMDMTMAVWDKIALEQPDLVVIEDVAMQRDAQALIKLARIQGGIMTVCATNQISYDILRPSTWRKYLNFKQGSSVSRSALKKQAKQYVLDHFNLKVTEDEADAICIGCAAVKKYIGEDVIHD